MSSVTIAIAEGSIGNPSWASIPAEIHGITLKYGPIETVEELVATTTGCDALIVSGVAVQPLSAAEATALEPALHCTAALFKQP